MTVLRISGVVGQSCGSTVARALRSVPGVLRADVLVDGGTSTSGEAIVYGTADDDALVAEVVAVGYGAQVVVSAMRLKGLKLSLNELAFLPQAPEAGQTVLARASSNDAAYKPGTVSVANTPAGTMVLLYDDIPTGMCRTARNHLVFHNHLLRAALLEAKVIHASDVRQASLGERVLASTYRGYKASGKGEVEAGERRMLMTRLAALQQAELRGDLVDEEALTAFHELQDALHVPPFEELRADGRLMERFAPTGQERYGVLFHDGSIEKCLTQDNVASPEAMLWMDALFDHDRPDRVMLRGDQHRLRNARAGMVLMIKQGSSSYLVTVKEPAVRLDDSDEVKMARDGVDGEMKESKEGETKVAGSSSDGFGSMAHANHVSSVREDMHSHVAKISRWVVEFEPPLPAITMVGHIAMDIHAETGDTAFGHGSFRAGEVEVRPCLGLGQQLHARDGGCVEYPGQISCVNDGSYDLDMQDGSVRTRVQRQDVWLEENSEVRCNAPRDLCVGARVLLRPLRAPAGAVFTSNAAAGRDRGDGQENKDSSESKVAHATKIKSEYALTYSDGRAETATRESVLSARWFEGTVIGTSLTLDCTGPLEAAIEYGLKLVGTKYLWVRSKVPPGDEPLWQQQGSAPEPADVKTRTCTCTGLVNLMLRHVQQRRMPPRKFGIKDGGAVADYYRYYHESGVAEKFLLTPAVPYPRGTLVGRRYRNKKDQGHVAVILSADGPESFILQAYTFPMGKGNSPGVSSKQTLRMSNNTDVPDVPRGAENFYDYIVRPEHWLVGGTPTLNYDVLPDDSKEPLCRDVARTELNCLSRKVVEQGAYVTVCRSGTVVRVGSSADDGRVAASEEETAGGMKQGDTYTLNERRGGEHKVAPGSAAQTAADGGAGDVGGGRWMDSYQVRYDAECFSDGVGREEAIVRSMMEPTNGCDGRVHLLPVGCNVLAYHVERRRHVPGTVVGFDSRRPVGSMYQVDLECGARIHVSREECIYANTSARLPVGARVVTRRRARITRAYRAQCGGIANIGEVPIVYDVEFPKQAEVSAFAGLHRRCLRGDPADIYLPREAIVHTRILDKFYRGSVLTMTNAGARSPLEVDGELFDKAACAASFLGEAKAKWGGIILYDAGKDLLWTRNNEITEADKGQRATIHFTEEQGSVFLLDVIRGAALTSVPDVNAHATLGAAVFKSLGAKFNYAGSVSSCIGVPLVGFRGPIGVLVVGNVGAASLDNPASLVAAAARMVGALQKQEVAHVKFDHGVEETNIAVSSIRFPGVEEGVPLTAEDSAVIQLTPTNKAELEEVAKASVVSARIALETALADSGDEVALEKVRVAMRKTLAAAEADALVAKKNNDGTYDLCYGEDGDDVVCGFRQEQLWMEGNLMMRENISRARLLPKTPVLVRPGTPVDGRFTVHRGYIAQVNDALLVAQGHITYDVDLVGGSRCYSVRREDICTLQEYDKRGYASTQLRQGMPVHAQRYSKVWAPLRSTVAPMEARIRKGYVPAGTCDLKFVDGDELVAIPRQMIRVVDRSTPVIVPVPAENDYRVGYVMDTVRTGGAGQEQVSGQPGSRAIDDSPYRGELEFAVQTELPTEHSGGCPRACVSVIGSPSSWSTLHTLIDHNVDNGVSQGQEPISTSVRVSPSTCDATHGYGAAQLTSTCHWKQFGVEAYAKPTLNDGDCAALWRMPPVKLCFTTAQGVAITESGSVGSSKAHVQAIVIDLAQEDSFTTAKTALEVCGKTPRTVVLALFSTETPAASAVGIGRVREWCREWGIDPSLELFVVDQSSSAGASATLAVALSGIARSASLMFRRTVQVDHIYPLGQPSSQVWMDPAETMRRHREGNVVFAPKVSPATVMRRNDGTFNVKFFDGHRNMGVEPINVRGGNSVVDHTGVTELAIQCRANIEDVDLSYNDIGGARGWEALRLLLDRVGSDEVGARSWLDIPNLGSLRGPAVDSGGFSALRRLNLRGMRLGPGGATVVAQSLLHNGVLAHLDLSANAIGDAGAVAVAGIIPLHPSLESLFLGDNTIGPAGAQALGLSLREFFPANIIRVNETVDVLLDDGTWMRRVSPHELQPLVEGAHIEARSAADRVFLPATIAACLYDRPAPPDTVCDYLQCAPEKAGCFSFNVTLPDVRIVDTFDVYCWVQMGASHTREAEVTFEGGDPLVVKESHVISFWGPEYTGKWVCVASDVSWQAVNGVICVKIHQYKNTVGVVAASKIRVVWRKLNHCPVAAHGDEFPPMWNRALSQQSMDIRFDDNVDEYYERLESPDASDAVMEFGAGGAHFQGNWVGPIGGGHYGRHCVAPSDKFRVVFEKPLLDGVKEDEDDEEPIEHEIASVDIRVNMGRGSRVSVVRSDDSAHVVACHKDGTFDVAYHEVRRKVRRNLLTQRDRKNLDVSDYSQIMSESKDADWRVETHVPAWSHELPFGFLDRMRVGDFVVVHNPDTGAADPGRVMHKGFDGTVDVRMDGVLRVEERVHARRLSFDPLSMPPWGATAGVTPTLFQGRRVREHFGTKEGRRQQDHRVADRLYVLVHVMGSGRIVRWTRSYDVQYDLPQIVREFGDARGDRAGNDDDGDETSVQPPAPVCLSEAIAAMKLALELGQEEYPVLLNRNLRREDLRARHGWHLGVGDAVESRIEGQRCMLRDLVMDGNDIGAVLATRGMREPVEMREFVKAVIARTTMKTLSLARVPLGNLEARHIAQSLADKKRNRNLRSIDLSGCGIGEPGVLDLLAMLGVNDALQNLVLANNGVDWSGPWTRGKHRLGARWKATSPMVANTGSMLLPLYWSGLLGDQLRTWMRDSLRALTPTQKANLKREEMAAEKAKQDALDGKNSPLATAIEKACGAEAALVQAQMYLQQAKNADLAMYAAKASTNAFRVAGAAKDYADSADKALTEATSMMEASEKAEYPKMKKMTDQVLTWKQRASQAVVYAVQAGEEAASIAAQMAAAEADAGGDWQSDDDYFEADAESKLSTAGDGASGDGGGPQKSKSLRNDPRITMIKSGGTAGSVTYGLIRLGLPPNEFLDVETNISGQRCFSVEELVVTNAAEEETDWEAIGASKGGRWLHSRDPSYHFLDIITFPEGSEGTEVHAEFVPETEWEYMKWKTCIDEAVGARNKALHRICCPELYTEDDEDEEVDQDVLEAKDDPELLRDDLNDVNFDKLKDVTLANLGERLRQRNGGQGMLDLSELPPNLQSLYVDVTFSDVGGDADPSLWTQAMSRDPDGGEDQMMPLPPLDMQVRSNCTAHGWLRRQPPRGEPVQRKSTPYYYALFKGSLMYEFATEEAFEAFFVDPYAEEETRATDAQEQKSVAAGGGLESKQGSRDGAVEADTTPQRCIDLEAVVAVKSVWDIETFLFTSLGFEQKVRES